MTLWRRLFLLTPLCNRYRTYQTLYRADITRCGDHGKSEILRWIKNFSFLIIHADLRWSGQTKKHWVLGQTGPVNMTKSFFQFWTRSQKLPLIMRKCQYYACRIRWKNNIWYSDKTAFISFIHDIKLFDRYFR